MAEGEIVTPSYYGDASLKVRLVANMQAHREADRIAQGSYFGRSMANSRPKGCAVGCTVADFMAAELGVSLAGLGAALPADPEWHRRWAEVTGLPLWLACVDDELFEALPLELAREWPLRLLEAIPVGADLAPVREAWARDVVFDPESGAMAQLADKFELAGSPMDTALLRGLTLTADWSDAYDILRFGVYGPIDTYTSLIAEDVSDIVHCFADPTAPGMSALGGRATRVADPEWAADRLIHHLAGAAA